MAKTQKGTTLKFEIDIQVNEKDKMLIAQVTQYWLSIEQLFNDRYMGKARAHLNQTKGK